MTTLIAIMSTYRVGQAVEVRLHDRLTGTEEWLPATVTHIGDRAATGILTDCGYRPWVTGQHLRTDIRPAGETFERLARLQREVVRLRRTAGAGAASAAQTELSDLVESLSTADLAAYDAWRAAR